MKQVEYMMRVKLPSNGAYASCPSGDTEYEEAFRNAINDRLPPGFEVSWSTQRTWPVDWDGFTWVRLYCTDKEASLAYWRNEAESAHKELTEIRAKLKEIVNALFFA